MKIFINLFLVSLIIFVISCTRDSGSDISPDDNSGSFIAKLDGVDWISNTEKVNYVVQSIGAGPQIYIVSLRISDTSQFSILMPYFFGSDTTVNFPSVKTTIQFQQRGIVWLNTTGSLNINKSVVSGKEILTGTFNGTFKDPVFTSTPLKIITAGAFTAKRLL